MRPRLVEAYVTRDHRRYLPLAPGSRYEQFVQRIVLRNMPALLPEYEAIPLEPLFMTPGGDVKPDMVLLRLDGSGWGLMEVELEVHGASSHVLPQLMKMTMARADESLVASLSARTARFDRAEIAAMTAGRADVFLVMHGSSARLVDRAEQLGVHVLDIDIHEHPVDDYVLTVQDRRPFNLKTDCVIERSRGSLLKNIWVLRGPGAVDLLEVDHLRVEMGEYVAHWRATTTQEGVLLRAPSDLPIDPAVDRSDVYVTRAGTVFIPAFVHRPQGEAP